MRTLYYSVFLDDMAEKNLKDITIHDVDPLALTLLVDFSYTGELSVCEENVQVDRPDRSPADKNLSVRFSCPPHQSCR